MIRKKGKKIILLTLTALAVCLLWSLNLAVHSAVTDLDTRAINDPQNAEDIIKHSLSSTSMPLSLYSSNHPSEDPDMLKRGKWQRLQIASFCRKHGLTNLNHTLPDKTHYYRQEVFRHMIYDNKSKILFCFMPKVGCTNMRISLLVTRGFVSPMVLRMHSSKHKYLVERKLETALKHATFLNPVLSDEDRLSMLKEYKRYTIVRHPLERLLSAYRDKIEGPLDKKTKSFRYFEQLKHQIMIKYHLEEYTKWNNTVRSPDISVSFATYLKWIISQNASSLNEHFLPQYYNCEPCRFDYHFYGNFKNFTSDASQIIRQFGSSFDLKQTSYHSKGNKTSNLLKRYYLMVPKSLKKKLLSYLELELDFYHHLYPYESYKTEFLLF